MKLIKENKAYASLLFSSIFSMLGTSLFNIVFLIFASRLPNPKIMISLAELCILLPIVFATYTGYLADKTKRKSSSMIYFSLIQGILFLFLIFFIEQRNVVAFFVVALVKISTDLMTSYKSGLRAPILQNNLSNENLQTAFGQIQGTSSIVEIIGQPLGVTILAISHQSFEIVLFINGILYFISGLILWLYQKKLTFKSTKSTQKYSFNIKTSLTEIKEIFTLNGDSNFIVLLFSLVMINFILAGIGPLISLAMLKFNPFPTNYGTAIMIFNVVLMLGMLTGSFMMNDRLKNWLLPELLIFSFLMISLFSFFITNQAIISLLFLFLLAYISSKASPKVNSLVFENISTENLGKVTGGITTLFTFSVPFGGAIFVFLANFISVPFTFYIIAIISILIFILLVLEKIKKK